MKEIDLAVLTLLVIKSGSANKVVMIRLIISMLAGEENEYPKTGSSV